MNRTRVENGGGNVETGGRNKNLESLRCLIHASVLCAALMAPRADVLAGNVQLTFPQRPSMTGDTPNKQEGHKDAENEKDSD